jgi:hypothetical protein
MPPLRIIWRWLLGGEDKRGRDERQGKSDQRREEESLTVIPPAGEEETDDGRRDRNGGIA